MLTEMCDFIHNYFEFAVHSGAYEVSNGTIAGLNNMLTEGQRFKIRGSAVNDGIYTYHADGITNDDDVESVDLNEETFSGTITAMSIPFTFKVLLQDIAAWMAKNKDVMESPYTSESFGGYSYTKASGNGGAGGTVGWQDVFRTRLNAYRKIA